jgi:hypothetical protein
MKPDENGGYYHRFDRIERDISGMREDLVPPLEKLSTSIERLTDKIDGLVSTHLKIIYWLLILISTAFVGTKGVEILKSLHLP